MIDEFDYRIMKAIHVRGDSYPKYDFSYFKKFKFSGPVSIPMSNEGLKKELEDYMAAHPNENSFEYRYLQPVSPSANDS